MADLDQEITNAALDTDTAILNEAFQDGAPEAAPEPEQAAPEEAPKGEQPRDERGQFASKAPPEQPQPEQAEPEQGKQPGKEEDAAIPSWRAREIAEEKRQAQAERDQLRAELARLQARMPKPEVPKQEEIDPLLDPQGFANRLRSEFEQARATDRLNFNLELAHTRHGEKFEKAYEALLMQGQAGNGQLVRHLTSQTNPGEAIVNWWNQQQVMREVGPDLASFRQKERDAALKDPEFLAKAVEAYRAAANGQAPGGQGQPRNIVQLPPSLSRATGTNANVEPIDTDNSEKAVFDYAFK